MAAKPRRFVFTAPLVKREDRLVYILEVPQHVTEALGRRGPIPVVATYGKEVEVHQSLVPMGGGRHWLQLNARTRADLKIEPGDPVHVELHVPDKPERLPIPAELADALKEADLQEIFSALAVGKQNHIITWIKEAARLETRAKRVAQTVEWTFRAREKANDRKRRA